MPPVELSIQENEKKSLSNVRFELVRSSSPNDDSIRQLIRAEEKKPP